jgi:hypothetical protein
VVQARRVKFFMVVLLGRAPTQLATAFRSSGLGLAQLD